MRGPRLQGDPVGRGGCGTTRPLTASPSVTVAPFESPATVPVDQDSSPSPRERSWLVAGGGARRRRSRSPSGPRAPGSAAKRRPAAPAIRASIPASATAPARRCACVAIAVRRPRRAAGGRSPWLRHPARLRHGGPSRLDPLGTGRPEWTRTTSSGSPVLPAPTVGPAPAAPFSPHVAPPPPRGRPRRPARWCWRLARWRSAASPSARPSS